MNAQSAALSAISDNVANSQTVGFKATNTDFIDYVSGSSPATATPDTVIARADTATSVQGSVTQVSNPTSLAVSGAGFFAVQRPTGATTFDPQQYYTRVGDFTANSAGYLVNSAGYALQGASGPIQISQAPSVPVPTSAATLAGNLPSTPTTDTVTTPYTTAMQVYDAGGNAQTLNLSWSQVATTPGSPISATNPAVPNQWNLTITGGTPAGTPPVTPTTGPMLVTFGSTAADAGTITGITAPGTAGGIAATVPATQATGGAATVTLPLNFGFGAQSVALNLGNFGSTNGMSQFAGTSYQITSQTQNGAAQGNFSNVTIKPTGDVVINYDNGSNRTVDHIPLVTFNNPDALQQQNGQAFTATAESGGANVVSPGTGGAGTLVVSAEEASNVDIAAQFTQMIVAQRAYTANTKMISTANQLLQDTLNMVQG